MGPCIIILQHEVMVVDEWHNNGPQDLVTVSLCFQNAINKMHLCSLSLTYACQYHNPTATIDHSIHIVDISKPLILRPIVVPFINDHHLMLQHDQQPDQFYAKEMCCTAWGKLWSHQILTGFRTPLDPPNTVKLHILEWPFIVASLRHTRAIVMLSNHHLDMPQL